MPMSFFVVDVDVNKSVQSFYCDSFEKRIIVLGSQETEDLSGCCCCPLAREGQTKGRTNFTCSKLKIVTNIFTGSKYFIL